MPSVVGTRPSKNHAGRGYQQDPIFKFAKSFNDVAQDILRESGIDMFNDPSRAMRYGQANEALKSFFVEGAVDEDAIIALEGGDRAFNQELIEEKYEAMNEQYENDREAVLEYASLNMFNPVIGMTFPLHKNILMNTIFDKGAIPKVVAREPKFTMTMETRYLVTPEGEEIDMFKEQYKMRDAINNTVPFTEVELELPEIEGTDILAAIGAPDTDSLSIASHISAVKVTVYLMTGDINPETGVAAEEDGEVEVWLPVKLAFTPSYGEYDRTMTESVEFVTRNADDTDSYITVKSVLAGYVKKNKFAVSDLHGNISAIKLNAKIDSSTAMVRTCSVRWDTRTDIVEIPEATPINTPVAPEEIKDVAALFNTNQLSKIMSMIKTVLGNYKDDQIKYELDDSFTRLPDDQKVATTFDFSPERAGYAHDHIKWRHDTFMEYIDDVTTVLLQVLNDPNMTISIFGSPALIRKITPTEYVYQAPQSIGPVELDFSRTIVTSDKRVYQFIGSDKLRDTQNLIVVLAPRNSERIIYRIYDYQMYVSNEIRNVQNYALPAIHAFERWKFVEYQPVQGRVKILHPTGLTNIAANDEPVQQGGMNDFNMLK